MPLARLSTVPIARILLGLACAGALFVPRPAAASLILALDTPTMVQRADLIAIVDVVSVTAAWDQNHERILTTVDLSVVDAWKGPLAPASHIKVVQPGGNAGDMTMVVFGMTHFFAGERALVFLQGSTATARVVGMAQGKRIVRRDAATGRWLVHAPDAAGAEFVRTKPTTPTGAPLPIFERHARPLEDVRTEVRDLVAKANAR